MLRGRIRRGEASKAAFAAGLSLIGMLPFRRERTYRPLLHLIFTFMMAGICFAYFFRERLLPRIGGRMLLAWNILLVFVGFRAGWSSPPQIAAIAIPTVPIA